MLWHAVFVISQLVSFNSAKACTSVGKAYTAAARLTMLGLMRFACTAQAQSPSWTCKTRLNLKTIQWRKSKSANGSALGLFGKNRRTLVISSRETLLLLLELNTNKEPLPLVWEIIKLSAIKPTRRLQDEKLVCVLKLRSSSIHCHKPDTKTKDKKMNAKTDTTQIKFVEQDKPVNNMSTQSAISQQQMQQINKFRALGETLRSISKQFEETRLNRKCSRVDQSLGSTKRTELMIFFVIFPVTSLVIQSIGGQWVAFLAIG